MGKAIAGQHPAVVLRSHYTLVRALLAAAMIAVVGLTVAVVIVANDGDEITGTTSARPIESINYGGFNPATGRPESAPLPQREHPLQSTIGKTRYDGGPEQGTRGIARSGPAPQVHVNPSTGYASGGAETGTRDVAPPPSSIAATEAWRYGQLRAARAQATGPSTERYDGGPEEGTRGPGFSTD